MKVLMKSSLLLLPLILICCASKNSNSIKEAGQEVTDSLDFSFDEQFYVDIIFKTQYVKDLESFVQTNEAEKVMYFITSNDSSIYYIQVGVDTELMFAPKYTFRCNTVDTTVIYLDYVDDAEIQIYPPAR
jgi:hypothetical protein